MINKLIQILDGVDEGVRSNKFVDRAIKKAKKGFDANKPAHVQHLTDLALYLEVLGDVSSAIKLLDFLDKNTGTKDIRDLAGFLADAQIALAYMYFLQNKSKKAEQILSKKNIGKSRNLESYDEYEYDNVLQASLAGEEGEMEAYESLPNVSRAQLLRAARVGYLDMIVLTGRLPEIEHLVKKKDKKLLADFLSHYREKLSYYLLK